MVLPSITVTIGIHKEEGIHKVGSKSLPMATLAAINDMGYKNIPPRPFIHIPFITNRQKITKIISLHLNGSISKETMEGLIREIFLNNFDRVTTPPLTKSGKKSRRFNMNYSKLLVDSGKLRDAIKVKSS